MLTYSLSDLLKAKCQLSTPEARQHKHKHLKMTNVLQVMGHIWHCVLRGSSMIRMHTLRFHHGEEAPVNTSMHTNSEFVLLPMLHLHL